MANDDRDSTIVLNGLDDSRRALLDLIENMRCKEGEADHLLDAARCGFFSSGKVAEGGTGLD